MSQMETINTLTENLMQRLETVVDAQDRYNEIKRTVVSAYMAGITYVEIIETAMNKKGNN